MLEIFKRAVGGTHVENTNEMEYLKVVNRISQEQEELIITGDFEVQKR